MAPANKTIDPLNPQHFRSYSGVFRSFQELNVSRLTFHGPRTEPQIKPNQAQSSQETFPHCPSIHSSTDPPIQLSASAAIGVERRATAGNSLFCGRLRTRCRDLSLGFVEIVPE